VHEYRLVVSYSLQELWQLKTLEASSKFMFYSSCFVRFSAVVSDYDYVDNCFKLLCIKLNGL